jgi:uncharacterized protein (TIGR03083 family)
MLRIGQARARPGQAGHHYCRPMADDSMDEWTGRGQAATAALAETWGSLAGACHALVTQEWALPTECPGWDVKDQLSHLIGIERMLAGDAAPEWDGPLGDHVKNDFAAMNEPWVAIRRAEQGAAVLAEFNLVTAGRLATLHGTTDAEWATVGWSPVGQVPLARFMETRVFDSWVHEQDVRHALDRPGGMGGRASDVGIGQVQSAMGMVVGKKAAAPEGAVVRFSISGAPGDARDFALAIQGGRANPAPADTPATVTLSMSSVDFYRLGCGRATAAVVSAEGGIRVDGDAALGQRVLDNMNFLF